MALLFVVALLAISVPLLSSYLAKQSAQHQQTVHAIAQTFAKTMQPQSETTSISKETAKELGNLLKKASNYHHLKIQNQTSTLYSLQTNSPQHLAFISPDIKSVSSKELALQIEYQLDFSMQLSFLTKIFYGILALALVFVFISAWLNYKLQAVIFRIISKQIRFELAQINSTDEQLNGAEESLLEIPALAQGINEIKQLMSEQLKNTTSLEIEAHVDSLTGIENRNRFVQFYENQIVQESPVNFGVLLITRCSELQTINQVQGYHAGDDYISKVADIIKNAIVTWPSAKIFRLNGSDFATILSNEHLKVAEKYASDLTLKFNEYQQQNELDSVAFTGLVYFDKSKPLGELLALADTGVSVAQTQNKNSWYSQKDINILNNTSANYGNQNWREEIDSVIEGQRIRLLLQPIQPSGRNSKVYSEVLARFLNSNDDMLPTASFIAMAEKLDKIVAIDKLIIETTIHEITSKNMLEQSYGINISARSISDEHFMIWLERKLLREPTAAPRLVFEITELGLQQNIKTSKRLIDMLHRVGARVTVERFGVGLTSFKFFRDLTPDYIKMDSSYTRDIDDDKNNQYFLRLMVDLAHRLGINVLAESVESQEEKHTLEKLFVDGCQGFYVGKPAAF